MFGTKKAKLKKKAFPLRTSEELKTLLLEAAVLCKTNRSHIAEIVNKWIISGRLDIDADGLVVISHPKKPVIKIKVPIIYYYNDGKLKEDSFSMTAEPVLNDNDFRRCMAAACIDQINTANRLVGNFSKREEQIYISKQTITSLYGDNLKEGIDYNVPESIVVARFLNETLPASAAGAK